MEVISFVFALAFVVAIASLVGSISTILTIELLYGGLE